MAATKLFLLLSLAALLIASSATSAPFKRSPQFLVFPPPRAVHTAEGPALPVDAKLTVKHAKSPSDKMMAATTRFLQRITRSPLTTTSGRNTSVLLTTVLVSIASDDEYLGMRTHYNYSLVTEGDGVVTITAESVYGAM